MTNKIGILALAAAALSLSGSVSAQTAEEHGSAPTIVLVHGAFADGSGWRGVYDELSARGYRVAIVQNPLTSLRDDVDATTRVIDRQTGPVILVGHSWGGTVALITPLGAPSQAGRSSRVMTGRSARAC